ncbi:Uma2 family endonuclease [Synechococcus sp. PCC 6312]|uniref:Uma2 family endonuclease n=1 Tax=Synechococcus sp. (strain ATCC 27167 / PCC 6312) TaxID=195253 RepID=UPI0002ECA94F|nr:Uma2 family endonuclease [Synechococcus sp. PCC 6312]
MIATTQQVWTFENETRLAWMIHPDERYVLVYHGPDPDQFLRIGDSLDGEEVGPGIFNL